MSHSQAKRVNRRQAPKVKRTPQRPRKKGRSQNSMRVLKCQVKVQDERMRFNVSAPTKWFRTFAKCLFLVLVVVIIRMLPEWWQAIQTATAVLVH